MDEKLLFCVSVRAGECVLYEAEWRETERGRTLIDLLVEVCGNKILGQDVQVLVSKERSFLEAAVVQVCTPLEDLADKSHSYIQYILKVNHEKFKQVIPSLKYPAERDVTNKISSTACTTTHSNITHAYNWRDSYSSKTFCVDNHSIDANKHSNWMHHFEDRTTSQMQSSFVDMTVEEICREIKRIKTNEPLHSKLNLWMDENLSKNKSKVIKDSDEKIKKMHNTPETRRPVVRSRNSSTSEDTKLNISNERQTKLKTKRPIPEKSSDIKTVNHPTKQSSSKRNSMEMTTPKKTLNEKSNKNTANEKLSKRTPSMDRLSALAQPRKSYVTTKKPVGNIRKAINKNKIKQPIEQNSKSNPLNTTFVQPRTKSKIETKMTSSNKKGENFFVEIFTKDHNKEENERVSNNKYHNKKDEQSNSENRSHMKKTLSSSTSNLSEKKTSPRKRLSYPMNNSETTSNNKKSQSELSHDGDNRRKSFTEHTQITNVLSPHIIDTDQVDSLLFDLLASDEVKSSMDSLIEDDLHRLAQKFSFTSSEDEDVVFLKSPQKESISGFYNENEQKDIDIRHEKAVENFVEHVSIETNTTHASKSSTEMWANSRGIKFLSNKKPEEVPTSNEGKDIEQDALPLLKLDLSNSSESDGDLDESIDKSIIVSPDKQRKHWGNQIEGMDSMLVASLQAFSLDLRKNSEHVATNIRILYENWREKYENLANDSIEENKEVLNIIQQEEIIDEKCGPEANQQKAMAQIFRNLRKMEVILKTIEQAAVTMVTVLKENETCCEKTSSEELDSSVTNNSIHRTKSFKWSELETAAKKQTRPQKWLHHKYNDNESDSENHQ